MYINVTKTCGSKAEATQMIVMHYVYLNNLDTNLNKYIPILSTIKCIVLVSLVLFLTLRSVLM